MLETWRSESLAQTPTMATQKEARTIEMASGGMGMKFEPTYILYAIYIYIYMVLDEIRQYT